MKNVRATQQTTPREEAIRVIKVYDWVVFPSQDRVDAVVPEVCAAAIEDALANGDTLSVDVITPTVGSFPLPPFPQPSPDPDVPGCRVLSLRRTTIPAPTGLVDGAIVRLLFTFSVTVVIFSDNTGLEICRFDVPIRLDDDVFVVLPEPLDEANIICSISSITASASGLIIDNVVEIDLCLCKEVQVEAEVNMEVLATFSSPRLPVPLPTDNVTPPGCICEPVVTFPVDPNQGLFPVPDGCETQAVLNYTTEFPVTVTLGLASDNTTVVDTGTVNVNLEICANCIAGNNVLSVHYTSSTDTVHNFVFTANTINLPPTTTIIPGATVLTLAGQGLRVSTAGSQPADPLTFLLVLTETAPNLPDTFALTLTNVTNFSVFTTGSISVPDEALVVTDCNQ